MPARRGRPRLPDHERKLHSIAFRPDQMLRDLLEASAARADRSMAQEVQHRLLQSYRDDDQRKSDFGNEENYRVFATLGRTVQLMDQRAGKRWLNDKQAFEDAVAQINTLLAGITPMPPIRGIMDINRIPLREDDAAREAFLRGFEAGSEPYRARPPDSKPDPDKE